MLRKLEIYCLSNSVTNVECSGLTRVRHVHLAASYGTVGPGPGRRSAQSLGSNSHQLQWDRARIPGEQKSTSSSLACSSSVQPPWLLENLSQRHQFPGLALSPWAGTHVRCELGEQTKSSHLEVFLGNSQVGENP